MDKKLQVSGTFKTVMIILIAVGVAAIVLGFVTDQQSRTWANLLLNNYYFVSLSLGAFFWLAIQAISQSGWSSGFLRIPQAMGVYLILGAILWMVLYFGLHDLYHWTDPQAVAHDALLQHKHPYLNVPFLIIRYALFFGLWIYLVLRINKLSLLEDQLGGLEFFKKIEFNSKVFIFVFAFTFSLFTIDWLMSLDPHWYSTIYAVKKFIMAFYHGAAVIVAVVIVLNKLGYFSFLTKEHLHDFSKYIFALSIIWGYMWLSQYLLIWYANIPEETIYYVPRSLEYYKFFFYAELVVNWLFPFLFLMWNRIAKNANALLFTVAVLIVGQWIELYMSIFPDTVPNHSIGFIEIGSFVGFAALFTLVVVMVLSKKPLIPKNHPYIMESMHEDGH